MKLFDLIIGKDVRVSTDMKVDVYLTVTKVEENHRSVDLSPSTRENDWYPIQQTWTTYTLHFANGASKTFDSLSQIEILE